MDCLIFIVEFFSGLISIFAVGFLISHLIKLDKYYDDFQKNKNKR